MKETPHKSRAGKRVELYFYTLIGSNSFSKLTERFNAGRLTVISGAEII